MTRPLRLCPCSLGTAMVSTIEPFTQARGRMASDLRRATFRQACRQCHWSRRLGMKVCSQPAHRMPADGRPLCGARSRDVLGRNAGSGIGGLTRPTTLSSVGIDTSHLSVPDVLRNTAGLPAAIGSGNSSCRRGCRCRYISPSPDTHTRAACDRRLLRFCERRRSTAAFDRTRPIDREPRPYRRRPCQARLGNAPFPAP